jgi:large subunit ribosomal protein L5
MAVPRLKDKYRAEIIPAMRERFGYSNVMQVPKVTKLTLNMGIGEGTHDAKAMEEAATSWPDHRAKAQVRRARKSVANFKLRAGMPVGLRVTLRGDRMCEMLDRLISIALPHPRLPGHLAQRVRRAGQLQPGHQGTDHLPGDRLRQDRQAPGLGCRHHHDGEDGR